ncbi:MAG: DNA repair protein RecO [Candidatus Electrothrix scaldis]|nr:MAG: DNA repair protein RecO [Candidatus Electrothrix sp. GW3-3]
MPDQLCRTEGIVLRSVDFGESDRIITLYSLDAGRLTVIAKGAKRSKKRFVNKLEAFSLLDVTYRPARQDNRLHFLSEAELKDAFLFLRTDWQRYSAAMLVCELVLRFTGEHDPDRRIFFLLHWALESIHRGSSPVPVLVFFLLHLLGVCGYHPSLDGCATCSCPPEKSRQGHFTLQPGEGALVCSRCRSNVSRSRFTLSLQSLKFLQTAQKMTIKQVQRLQMPEHVAIECLFVLSCYAKYLLQADLHSWNFFARNISQGGGRNKEGLHLPFSLSEEP